eukprot:g41341.t1
MNWEPEPQRILERPADPDRSFTVEELAKYDGKQSHTSPIYLAAKGVVYDVTHSGFYGPKASYPALAGRDSSVALAKMDLANTADKEEDFAALDDVELGILEDWVMKYKMKYEVVGKLKDSWWFDEKRKTSTRLMWALKDEEGKVKQRKQEANAKSQGKEDALDKQGNSSQIARSGGAVEAEQLPAGKFVKPRSPTDLTPLARLEERTQPGAYLKSNPAMSGTATPSTESPQQKENSREEEEVDEEEDEESESETEADQSAPSQTRLRRKAL